VNLQQHRRIGPGVTLEVTDARFVGRAHLAEVAAAGLHDLRHPEAAADLHQFGAAYQDFLSDGERVEREKDSAGAVVYDKGRLSPGEQPELPLESQIAVAARLRGGVPFEVAVAGEGPYIELFDDRPEWSPAKIGVDQNTRAVHDPAGERTSD